MTIDVQETYIFRDISDLYTSTNKYAFDRRRDVNSRKTMRFHILFKILVYIQNNTDKMVLYMDKMTQKLQLNLTSCSNVFAIVVFEESYHVRS